MISNNNNIIYPNPQKGYKVLVRCFTYNQSKYIEDALNGFAMQQTNFPFTCLVMDDASTDGEQDVIKAWMELECDMSRANIFDIPTSTVTIVPHRTNISCTFAFYFLKLNLYKLVGEKMRHVTPWREKCEYEAICEGDDYWVDPLKLQKQIDFLDANPEYGLVHTNYKCYYQKNKTFICNKNKKGEDSETLEHLLKQNTIATLTSCFRSEIYNKIPKYYTLEDFRMGDYPMWIEIAAIAKIKYIPKVTSIYRILDNSASHPADVQSQLLFNIDAIRVREFYIKKYNFHSLINETRKELLYWNAVLSAVRKERKRSIHLYVKSKNFGVIKTLRFFKYLLLGELCK